MTPPFFFEIYFKFSSIKYNIVLTIYVKVHFKFYFWAAIKDSTLLCQELQNVDQKSVLIDKLLWACDTFVETVNINRFAEQMPTEMLQPQSSESWI